MGGVGEKRELWLSPDSQDGKGSKWGRRASTFFSYLLTNNLRKLRRKK